MLSVVTPCVLIAELQCKSTSIVPDTSMEWLHITIILPFVRIILATDISTLETVIAGVGEDKLSAGENLKQLASLDIADEYLAKEGDVGIVLDIENYSDLVLVDPEIHPYAGEKDKE